MNLQCKFIAKKVKKGDLSVDIYKKVAIIYIIENKIFFGRFGEKCTFYLSSTVPNIFWLASMWALVPRGHTFTL